MTITRRETIRLAALWAGLAFLRWIAALPITAPRIFRDELLHWQMANAIAFHKQFLVGGQPVDYPAVLYPLLLSIAAHVSDMSVAFRVVQGLNAVVVSAVVLSAYALAREFCEPRVALAAAALAGLAPGGVYSALIMEENLYYPLFVLSCWLCFRVLTVGGRKNAAACAVALCLTYFTKPVGLPLVVAYTATVIVWAALELRSAGTTRNRFVALAIRLAPAVFFGLVLVIRHALTAPGQNPAAPSGLLLSRFYAEELGGPLVPAIGPLAVVSVALFAALTLGTGVAPMVALVRSFGSLRRDRRRMWLTLFATILAAIYILAAARHTMVMNDTPKIHERYLFAVGPLFITLFFAERPPRLGPVAIAMVCAAILLVVGPLAHVALNSRTWSSAPSLTLAASIRDAVGPRVAFVLIGAFALVICAAVLRARGATRQSFALLAAALLVLNAGWYATLYLQRYLDAPLGLVRSVQNRLAPGERVVLAVKDIGDPLRLTSEQAKFWLADRATVYWAGRGSPPWYADMAGSAIPASLTDSSYIIAAPGFRALCPAAHELKGLQPDHRFPVAVFRVEPSGCRPWQVGGSSLTGPQ